MKFKLYSVFFLVVLTLLVSCTNNPIQYDVIIKDGDNNVSTVTVDSGSSFNRPSSIEKEGFIFDGFYNSSDFTEETVFPIIVNSNITIYIKYIIEEVEVVKSPVELAIEALNIPSIINTFGVTLPTIDLVNLVGLEWATSDPSVLTKEGVALPNPIGGVAKNVVLSLIASKPGFTTIEKSYNITVNPISESEVTSIVSLPVYDKNDEYNIEEGILDTYYINNGHVPYVDIKEFLDVQEGVVYASEIDYAFTGTTLTLSFIAEGIDDITLEEYSYTFILVVDYEANTISVNILDFFDYLIYSTETNYSLGLNVAEVDEVEGSSVLFELNPYRFDAVYYEVDSVQKVLLPEFLLSQLFLAPGYSHLYYNGDAYYSMYFLGDDDSKQFNEIRKSSKNSSKQFHDVRVATFDSLVFNLDYLYGLKDDKGVTSFYNEISVSQRNNILSLTTSKNLDGVASFIYKGLDEMHSSYSYGSIYGKIDDKYKITSASQFGSSTYSWYTGYWDVQDEYKKKKGAIVDSDFSKTKMADVQEIDRTVIISGNTAFIYLEGFETDTSDDASYKTDSYLFMVEALEFIKSKSSITTIVLDLSYNTGGNVGAMFRVLGFMTDEKLPYSNLNPLTGAAYTAYYEVDIDLDDNYDGDAYSEYKWVILTSSVSFSAANSLTNVAKNLNIPVIGNKTGGGGSSIAPVVLADGTGVILSSNSTSATVVDGAYVSIEHGVEVDYEFDSVAYFFDYSWIANFITTNIQ